MTPKLSQKVEVLTIQKLGHKWKTGLQLKTQKIK